MFGSQKILRKIGKNTVIYLSQTNTLTRGTLAPSAFACRQAQKTTIAPRQGLKLAIMPLLAALFTEVAMQSQDNPQQPAADELNAAGASPG